MPSGEYKLLWKFCALLVCGLRLSIILYPHAHSNPNPWKTLWVRVYDQSFQFAIEQFNNFAIDSIAQFFFIKEVFN